MRLKKAVVYLTVLSLTALSFAGCKKRELPVDEVVDTEKDPFEEEEELVPEENAELLIMTSCVDFATEMASKFEEQYADYNVKITIEDKGLGLIDKLVVDGPAGNGADVIITAHDEFNEAMNAQLFYEFSPSLTKDLADVVNEVGMKSVTYDGGIYGVPVALETSCLFYNKDIVGDTPATTFEEIYNKSADFNDYDNNMFYFLNKLGDGYKLHPFFSAYGYKPFGENGTDSDPGFDSDEFEKGLEVIASLKSIMNLSSTDLGSDNTLTALFKRGNLAYLISGPWDVNSFDQAGINYGVTTLPTYDGNPMVAFAGVQNAHVSAYTKYPKAAQLFAASFVTEDAAAVLYEKENKITTRKDISNVKGLSEDEKTACFVEQFSNSVPMPSAAEVTYYWAITEQISKLVFDGEITPSEGRTKAIESWKTLTESNQ